MTRQAISAAGADGLASGGFLASFALILGASNFHIGIMTAIPFIMQPLQLVAVLAIERLRLRKAVARHRLLPRVRDLDPDRAAPLSNRCAQPERRDPSCSYSSHCEA